MREQTLIILKPDAICRGLMGEIISRFEKVSLKVVAAKMVQVTQELANKQYPLSRKEWLEGMGKKTLENYKELSVDPKGQLGTEDPLAIGKIIQGWLVEMITSGPVLAAVLEGPHAVSLTRKLCGHTLPLSAQPGTIRGDLSFDSSYLANTGKRAIKNLIHASGTLAEAKYEISLWFSPDEIHSYERSEEKVMR